MCERPSSSTGWACLVALTLTGLAATAPASGESANKSKPNIILILADDMGYSDLPKFGKSEIPTPAIDRLAQEGTLFTDAYVTAPICVASRMGLMTGQYQQRFGIYDNIYGEEKNPTLSSHDSFTGVVPAGRLSHSAGRQMASQRSQEVAL